MDNPANTRLYAIVEGHVQGVGFRYFVLETAQQYGLKGWVRNRWDGSVEITAEGPRPTLERLLAAVRRGPRGSQVIGVQEEWLEATGEFASFSVRYTA